jgi:cobalt-zinc-cadmium efflux system membrane fusion protein
MISRKSLQSAGIVGLLLLVLGVVAAALAGVQVPWKARAKEDAAPAPATGLAVELVDGMPHTLLVPEETQTALGIRKGKAVQVAVAAPPVRSRPLVMSGSTSLDPARVMRIRARFAPAEVVEIGQVRDDATSLQSGRTTLRELRPGDRVNKGDVLGVFYSVDVGSKKNDLIDALVQLRLDQEVLDRAEKAHLNGSLPEVFLLNARRNVQADHNAISRAVNTLKTWNIPDEDIQAVRDEAGQINKRHGERDREKESKWARVELKAPDDGTIIETNVRMHEIVVDGTTNLFTLARVDRLLVLANAPEDDLPILQGLTGEQRRWTVRTAGASPRTGLAGTIDEIGYLIDPNQHTAVIKGYIDNPGERLRAGQYVTATVDLPPPPDVVEVPTSALVDDGKQCVVFVQPEDQKPLYTLRRVQVTHRFDKTVFVRSRLASEDAELTADEKEEGFLPRQPLRPGERVLTSGALELKKELEDRESGSGKDT